MKKTLYFIILFITSYTLNAQKKSLDSTSTALKPSPIWKNKGSFKFILNQSSYSNWVAGGDNNIGGNLSINYNLNYKKALWSWNTRVVVAYGLSKTAEKATKKTDDKIELNSVVSYIAGGKWSYSFFTNIKTQFTVGYKDYNANPRKVISNFLSPGYFYFGPGMLWTESDNFSINLSPATSRITVVRPEQSGNFGVSEGETMNSEFGFNGTVYYKFEILQNVYIENIFIVYVDYLKNVKNILLDYQLNITLKVNKYLSTNINIEIISDSNASSRIQSKELLGVGLNIGI